MKTIMSRLEYCRRRVEEMFDQLEDVLGHEVNRDRLFSSEYLRQEVIDKVAALGFAIAELRDREKLELEKLRTIAAEEKNETQD